jgi:hypothetical protein
VVLGTIFPNTVLNNTCDSSWVPPLPNSASTTTAIAGAPFGTCRVATLGLTSDPGAPLTTQLQFPLTSTSTVDTWGIDNGKFCAAGAGFINVAVTKTVLVGNTVGTAAAGVASLNCDAGGICTLVTGFTGNQALTDIQVGQTFTLSSSATLTMTGCGGTAAQQTAVAAALVSGPIDPRGIFTALTVTPGVATVSAATITFRGFNSAICTGTAAGAIASTGTLSVTGSWSPLCDNDNSYYLLNTVIGTGQLGGCPRCMTATNTPTRFVYTGVNQGKFCSALNTKGIYGNPVSPIAAGLAGTSCIAIGVTDLTAGSADTGKPMMSPVGSSAAPIQPLPYGVPTGYTGTATSITIANIFPTPNNVANPGRFSTNAILDFNAVGINTNAAVFKRVALDTQWGVPCSTPAISQPTSNSLTALPIVGNVVLVAPTSPATGNQMGAGTCNTMSVFYNGGTGVSPGNGIPPDGYSSGVLTSLFLASVASFPPPPASPSPPAPVPRPAPPPIAPAPLPGPPAGSCTYIGQFLIESVICPGKFMAFRNEENQCKNTTVMLRTSTQSEGNRKIWKLNGSAVAGVTPLPSSIIAVGRLTSCPNNRVPYLASANGPPSPRLAGSGWKFIIRPIDATKTCDIVSLQAAGQNPYTGQYLGYAACSSQVAFTWGPTSATATHQWKLTREVVLDRTKSL